MSIIQQHSNATIGDNWRTINIDLLDPESSSNFDTATLHPAFAPVSDAEVRSLGQQVRQLLRGGDAEGALRGALESAPYGGDAAVKVRLFACASSAAVFSFVVRVRLVGWLDLGVP